MRPKLEKARDDGDSASDSSIVLVRQDQRSLQAYPSQVRLLKAPAHDINRVRPKKFNLRAHRNSLYSQKFNTNVDGTDYRATGNK